MTLRKSQTILLAVALLAAFTFPAKAAGKDAAKDPLKGSWVAKHDGKTMTVTFAAGKFSGTTPEGKNVKGTYTTDHSKSPKHLDIAIKEGDEKFVGKTALCIYEVNGKKLKWCANDPGKGNARPTEFPESQGGGRDYLYLVFSRAKKAEKKSEKTAVEKSDKESDLVKMQGDWKVLSGVRGGEDAPAEVLNSKLKIEKNTFTLISTRNGRERKSPIQVKLDAAKSPRQIDFIKKDGRVESKGIYKLEGKKLTVCFGNKQRPEKFESKGGSRTFLMVFQREK